MIRAATLAGVLREMDHEDKREGINRFLSYLKARNLLAFLPSIIRHLEREDKREKDKSRVSIETPFEISVEARSSIRTSVGATGEAEEKIVLNKDLIGGFIAEYNYRRYDASMRRMLEQLRGHLLH